MGDTDELRDMAGRYFNSIHHWLPVISETLFYERLPSLFDSPEAGNSLLAMCVALITSIPLPSGFSRDTEDLYAACKTGIALTESHGRNSMETVQARLLVTLFEYGHGLEVAYISLGALARAAAALGMNETKEEEGRRVWWGVVMLDRYYALEMGGYVLATAGLGAPRFLPRDGDLWDEKAGCL